MGITLHTKQIPQKETMAQQAIVSFSILVRKRAIIETINDKLTLIYIIISDSACCSPTNRFKS